MFEGDTDILKVFEEDLRRRELRSLLSMLVGVVVYGEEEKSRIFREELECDRS